MNNTSSNGNMLNWPKDYGENLAEGYQVEICPSNDLWMMGDRFGVISKIDLDNDTAKVKMRITGKTVTFPLLDLKRTT